VRTSNPTYRGISLLNTGYKIYASIIKNKLTKFYENLIGEQNGFRKGRSCSDGYFSLKLIIEKHKRDQYRLIAAISTFIKATSLQ
jgi:hypothetical protein